VGGEGRAGQILHGKKYWSESTGGGDSGQFCYREKTYLGEGGVGAARTKLFQRKTFRSSKGVRAGRFHTENQTSREASGHHAKSRKGHFCCERERRTKRGGVFEWKAIQLIIEGRIPEGEIVGGKFRFCGKR